MKKKITTVVVSICLLGALAVPASAQGVNEAAQDGRGINTYQNNSSNYQANNVRANATDNDNDMDWGWLGLLGLLGLAGMRKRVSDHSTR
ncbi:WGxxGxxG family protein [Paenibacillus polymyxa]|uniref:WGxxGxxG family protein n=1 Tax=Paenibacillus TaxID=44249 RepID=UPI0008915FAD|nr:WGxxGxxG family protein [Paenibacillus sp. CF095]UOK61202.1 WGxxGxxG-CTERM domain-containing protein [Paenibacillus sp. OVF10]SDC56048.1 MYXO-CTERM domain-containing protein [Paenibacillus sp. CF095]